MRGERFKSSFDIFIFIFLPLCFQNTSTCPHFIFCIFCFFNVECLVWFANAYDVHWQAKGSNSGSTVFVQLSQILLLSPILFLPSLSLFLYVFLLVLYAFLILSVVVCVFRVSACCVSTSVRFFCVYSSMPALVFLSFLL